MRKALVIVPLAVLTTGCSQLLYPGLGHPMMAPYSRRTAALAMPPIGRWDNVMRLPAASTVDVLTVDGVPTVGSIVSATAQSVTLRSGGVDVRVDRREIVRVDLVDLAGSEVAEVAKSTARGAALGAAAVTVVGAVIGGQAWPPPGVLVRAGVAAGAASGLQTGLATRQRRILYIAPWHVPAPTPSWQVPYDEEVDAALLPGRCAGPACASAVPVGGVPVMRLPGRRRIH